MEYRSLSLKYEKGKVVEVSITADLDITYKLLFQNAKRASKRNPQNIEHGIKVIIFGCFMLESRSNWLMKFILYHEITNDLKINIWNTLKKNNFHSKMEILSSLATQKQKRNYSELINPLKQLFDLRNRLAHFKNEEEIITEKIELAKVEEYVLNPPIPNLTKELFWNRIELYAKTISDTNIWFNSVTKTYYKKYGIMQKNKSKELSP